MIMVKDGGTNMQANGASHLLEVLNSPVHLEIRLDELRMILNCFRAVEYQMAMDDEPYLDDDALDLKRRLERAYVKLVNDLRTAKAVN